MQAKGSVVKSISKYVEDQHPNEYKSWMGKLPQSSQDIFSNPIFATEWYPIDAGVVAPTQVISDMFFSDTKKAAWESGRYSAQVALTGIYKVFILVSTPAFMMSRARKIIASFYDPTELSIVDSNSKSMTMHITKLPQNDTVLEYRIGGWSERALEICGCNDLDIKITRSLVSGDECTEYEIVWK